MKEPNRSKPEAPVLQIAWVRWWSALAYYAFSLTDGMQEIGVPSCIVAPPGSPLEHRARERGIAAPAWADLGSASVFRWLGAFRRLRRAVRQGEIRAILCHTGVGHASAALALRGSKTPLLRTRAEIRPPSGGPLQRWLYARATDRIVISGEALRGSVRDRLGVEPSRIVTLPAGIDPTTAGRIDKRTARSRLRADASWPASAPVIGMLARYSPVKGHRDLIGAARLLLPRHPDLRYYAAGPKGQTGRAQVAAWVRDAGLADRFVLSDRIEEPLETAAGFDIAVIASRDSEAVCRSALEYMSLGLPIVATDVGAIPETIGAAGRIVPPGDPEQIAMAIESLLASREQRQALGSAAAERIEKSYDRLQIARRAVSIIEEVERGKIVR